MHTAQVSPVCIIFLRELHCISCACCTCSPHLCKPCKDKPFIYQLLIYCLAKVFIAFCYTKAMLLMKHSRLFLGICMFCIALAGVAAGRAANRPVQRFYWSNGVNSTCLPMGAPCSPDVHGNLLCETPGGKPVYVQFNCTAPLYDTGIGTGATHA